MLSAGSEVCLVLDNPADVSLVTQACRERGLTRLTVFPDGAAALESALRKQYELFFLRFENRTMSGLVFLQKLRASGNYGMETHFFLADKLDEKGMNVLTEFDLHYVLLKPFTPERMLAKLDFVLREEAHVTEQESKYRMAKSALVTGMEDIGEALAKELLSISAYADKAHVILGDVAMKRKLPTDARKSYEEALKANPKSAAAAHKLAETYMAEKNYLKATELMNTLTEQNPFNLSLLVNAGLSNLESGNSEKAKELLAEVKHLDAKNVEASKVMAKVHLKEGNYEAMCAALQETHSEKDVVSSLNHLGVEMSHKGDFTGAMSMYHNCLAHIHNNEFLHVIYYNMGLCCYKMHDYAKAREHLTEALRRRPDFEKAIQALGALPEGC